MQDVMDVKQVSDYLGLAPTTIYKLIEKKDIPASKIGKQYRFSRYEVLGWLSAKSICDRKYALGVLRADLEASCRYAEETGISGYGPEDIEKIVQAVRERK